ncbi:MAG: glycosyltransferase family 4 protein [Tyzzerella sp.]|nr:glycosyltransferase family 4 protein [Tyzzerella sp.]
MGKKIICYIDTLQLGGAERVMANLCNHLVEKGNDVVLINDLEPTKKLKEYEIDSRVERIFLDKCKSKNRVLNNIYRVIMLRKSIQEQKASVIISFLGPPNLRMLIATIGLRLKKIVSVRNDPKREYGVGVKKIVSNLLFGLADGVVFQTKEASEYFNITTQKKAAIIANPVKLSFFNQKQLEENDSIVVIGRLQPQKNPSLVLNAYRQIKEEFPTTTLDFYGEGELKENLIKTINRYGLQDNVFFHGQVSNTSEILASAKVYVLSSDYEGMPNALMEAMAVGIPIISTNCPCGGPKCLIENSEQGFLVNVGDANEIAEHLRIILSEKTLRDKMRVAARKRAEDFKPEKIFKQWLEYINKVCG